MWHAVFMRLIHGSRSHETAELNCYREALGDNFRLLMEVLEVMRREATYMRDEPATTFLAGVGQAVSAFAHINTTAPLGVPKPNQRTRTTA